MSESIHPGVRIGHAHLRVADLKRATDFYHEVLGFDVVVYGPEYGVEAAFLSAGATTTTSGSTPGRAQVGRRHRPVIPACTMWPSSILTAGNWLGP